MKRPTSAWKSAFGVSTTGGSLRFAETQFISILSEADAGMKILELAVLSSNHD